MAEESPEGGESSGVESATNNEDAQVNCADPTEQETLCGDEGSEQIEVVEVEGPNELGDENLEESIPTECVVDDSNISIATANEGEKEIQPDYQREFEDGEEELSLPSPPTSAPPPRLPPSIPPPRLPPSIPPPSIPEPQPTIEKVSSSSEPTQCLVGEFLSEPTPLEEEEEEEEEKASSLPDAYSPLSRAAHSHAAEDNRKAVQSCRLDTKVFEKLSTKGFSFSMGNVGYKREDKTSAIQLATSSNLISEVQGYLVEVPTEKADFETLLEPEPEYYRHTFHGHSQILLCGTGAGESPVIISILKKKAGGAYKSLVVTKEGFEALNVPSERIDKIVLEKTFERRVQVFFETEYKCTLMKVDKSLSSAILKLEEEDPQKTRCVTFGVIYVKEGQTDENEIFANVTTSPEFEEFLTFLGDKVPLCGWTGFRGGLDIKTNTKGTHSIFTNWNSFNIMYHVATLLPFNPKDQQQLERKNMIGNDIVTVVFIEGDAPYKPNTITSHMNHIIAVVRPKTNEKGVAGYELGIVFKDTVPPWVPPCPEFLEKGFVFRNFFLSKLMNGVITARRSQAFKRLFSIPRQAAMNEIIEKMKAKKGKGGLLKMFG